MEEGLTGLICFENFNLKGKTGSQESQKVRKSESQKVRKSESQKVYKENEVIYKNC